MTKKSGRKASAKSVSAKRMKEIEGVFKTLKFNTTKHGSLQGSLYSRRPDSQGRGKLVSRYSCSSSFLPE